ncbi:ATPase [Novosphingobium mangrovi (ex Huang et al. 2023)]|uniref:ATPase n=1 Tax=Novosphingobium mangrovi (ex Huang et al. 2023) TaxID=2976432 RepID=A0ABT2I3Y1_9SPHN|nr:ATPase [Novosphingobium mangrovi (ex Huang et al. 2023)]MCT2399509.1 ATPase [Novosphingobium mangrovi (ex Huang et al. 2023)]
MAGENRIIAFGANGGDGSDGEHEAAALTAEAPGAGTETADTESHESWDDAWAVGEEGEDLSRSRAWIAPAIAGLAVAGWSALFVFANLPGLTAGVPLAEVPGLVMQWCVPVLLIGLVWLLALRHSAREGKRFGDVARTLSTESALLEQRLTTVNRELSLAREFIAAQSRDLETLGRLAAERLSKNAQQLQDLVRDNGARVDSISTVSTAALENMEKLRSQLPVIASSAKDVTNNIANAGRTAHVQLEDMIQGFNKLNEFGVASERQVETLRNLVAVTLTEFRAESERFDTVADERFAALAERGEEFRTQLDKHEVDALAAIRTRAAALADEIDSTRKQLDQHEAESLTSLRARLGSLRDESDVVSRALRDAEVRAGEALRESLETLNAEQEATTARIVEAQRGVFDALKASLEVLRDEQSSAADNLAQTQQGVVDTLRGALETLRTEQSSAAHNLAQTQRGVVDSLKASLETLRAEQSSAAEVVTQAQQRVVDALGASLDALREEQSATAASLTENQQGIVDTLRASLATLRNEQSAAAESISTAQQTALDALAGRLATLDAEALRMDEALSERGERLAIEAEERNARQVEHERHAIARIEHMLGELDGTIAERLERHRQQATALSEHASAVTAELGEFEARLTEIAAQSGEAEAYLTSRLEALTERLTAARATLAATDGDVEKLTDDSVRLLELIQASAKNTHSALPEALSISEDRVHRLESAVSALLTLLQQSAESGDNIASGIERSGASLEALVTRLADAQSTVASGGETHAAQLAGLQATLAEIDETTQRLTGKARDELTAAIGALRTTLVETVEAIETDSAARIAAVAQSLSDESGQAIEKAMRGKVAEVSGQLEQAVSHATGVTREAGVQMRDQLARIDELVGNLENRIAQARERAEEQVDNDFTRRVALLTESLNSNSIDIAGALSTDVSDTAWAAYLRGDRGIFTRRAVSLLDSSETKAIQQLFERDDAFREHVSRYIHDFEAVLRQILSTRDGNALGVTLLSSDIGKLYVALAQGIERLRG